MYKKALILTILTLSIPFLVLAQEEGPRIFQAEPLAQEQSKGRNIKTCLAGWRQFLAAGIGYESFTDYWRDFFLWPMHYADVANVQDQLNKARYSVMAAFLRCDLNHLKSVTEAYYRLEAELYFVRHFVDTEGGFAKILTETPDDRVRFEDEMLKYLILRKKSQDASKDRALFSGYFDLFAEKYKERGKSYATFGKDPVYKELAKKFEQLLTTFKSFGKTNKGVENAAGRKEKEGKEKKPEKEPSLATAPKKSLRERAAAIASKFIDACVTAEDKQYCLLGQSRPEAKPFSESSATKMSEKRTFEEAIVAITKQELIKREDLTAAELLSRYEFLYGDINGDGITEVLKKMDNLNAILTKGSAGESIQGSFESLEKLKKCAATALERQCKG